MQLPSVLLAPLPGNCPPMSALCSGGGRIPPRPIRQDKEPSPRQGCTHDGFIDYDFLMCGLLSRVADPIPSGVFFFKELLEGKLCILLILVGVCVYMHRHRCVHRCEPGCVCVCAHVHLDVDVNIGSSKPLWFCFLLRDHLANKSLINNNATIF